jgi:hemolysin D
MRAHLRQLRDIWRESVAIEKDRVKVERRPHELEFLPAAIEIVETPASPTARALALGIGAIFLFALAWSIAGSIDTVAVAPGKIIPGDRVKVIQTVEHAVVAAIHVRDGQSVAKDALLLEFDPTETRANRDRIRREWLAARLDVARLSALAQSRSAPEAAFRPPPEADADLVATSRNSLHERWREHNSKVASLDADIRQLEAKRRAFEATIAKLDASIPMLTERVRAREILARNNTGTVSSYLELAQALVGMKGDLAVTRHQIEETAQAIEAAARRREELVAAFRAQLQDDLTKALRQQQIQQEELAKAEIRLKQTRVLAPAAGIVQQLRVHTIGAVLKPADAIMILVPHDAELEIEASVLNKDIGFVRSGQDAEIKVEAFPFTKYGSIRGKVVHVSADAVQTEKQGLIYTARINLVEKRIRVGDGWVNLTPGMAVTAEVKTGERRVIDYFLAPLIRYQDEALRER